MVGFDPMLAPLDCNDIELFIGDTVRSTVTRSPGMRTVGEVTLISATRQDIITVTSGSVVITSRASLWERIKQGAISKLQE